MITRGEWWGDILLDVESASDEEFRSRIPLRMFSVDLPKGTSRAEQIFAYELLESFVDLLFERDAALRKLSDLWTEDRSGTRASNLIELANALVDLCRLRRLVAAGRAEPPTGLLNTMLRRLVLTAEIHRRYTAAGRESPALLMTEPAFPHRPLDAERFLKAFLQEFEKIITIEVLAEQTVRERLHQAVDEALDAQLPTSGKRRNKDPRVVADLLYQHVIERRTVDYLARELMRTSRDAKERSRYTSPGSAKATLRDRVLDAERHLGLHCERHKPKPRRLVS